MTHVSASLEEEWTALNLCGIRLPDMAAEVVTVLVGCRPEADSLIHTEAKGIQVQTHSPDVQAMVADKNTSRHLIYEYTNWAIFWVRSSFQFVHYD
jgi:hypothetical protein